MRLIEGMLSWEEQCSCKSCPGIVVQGLDAMRQAALRIIFQ